MLPSVGGGLTVRAIERKEGLECTRRARLGPKGVGRPRVVGRRKGEGGSGSRTRARIEGRWEEKHAVTLDPEQLARAPMRRPGWAERDVEVRVGGEPRPDMTEE